MDVQVRGEGSVVEFRLLTETAREWVDHNVQSDPWQWLGGSLVVDHRYAEMLVDGMLDDGLEVEQ